MREKIGVPWLSHTGLLYFKNQLLYGNYEGKRRTKAGTIEPIKERNS